MNLLQSIILGIVQGLTEFLPISSSGHLVIFQNLLGFQEPQLLLDSALHVGTLVAVCFYFRSDLLRIICESCVFIKEVWQGRQRLADIRRNPGASLALWIIVGTVPIALIGLFFRSTFERAFGSLPVVGCMLIVTGLILAVSYGFQKKARKTRRLGPISALAVGTAQGLAIIPGISRSGITIVSGILMGLPRDEAARFSFLLSIPAILGALVLQLDAEAATHVGLLPLLAGFLASGLVGLWALKILMAMVRKGRLAYFAPYCLALGAAALIYAAAR